MTFTPNQRLYTHCGITVDFDHAVGETAYVRPILTTICQSTTYSGDDYEEFEEETPASHLLVVSLAELSASPPVQKIDETIIERLAELEAVQEVTRLAVKERENATRAANKELREAEDRLTNWKRTHGTIEDIGLMLDGVELFPLHFKNSNYHSCSDVPYVPEWKNISVLSLHQRYPGQAVDHRGTPPQHRHRV